MLIVDNFDKVKNVVQCVKHRGKLRDFDMSLYSNEESELLENSEVEVKANSLILVAMGK